MNYSECVNYLYDNLPIYQRIGAAAYKADLSSTIALMKYFGNPEKRFKSIHIAGTNGKGSVSHNLASIYQEAGYKTGLYTSPHLKDFRERILVNGEKIPYDAVINFVKNNKHYFDRIRPSFFEITVAMAFLHFSQQQVDIAIVETGMGGRLDSTNVITPKLSIITNISKEHSYFLGDKLADIAREKGGIIKINVPVIIGETNPETTAVFEQISMEKQAPVCYADQIFRIQEEKTVDKPQEARMYFSAVSTDNGNKKTFSTPLTGKYQLENFRTVLAACRLIGTETLPETAIENGIKNCIANTHLKGRWQILKRDPLCIADIGHNPAGIAHVCKQLQEFPPEKLHIVIGLSDDKDAKQILSFFPIEARYYFCKADIPRGMNAYELRNLAEPFGLYGKAYQSVKNAFVAAKHAASKDDVIFVGGSTFVVAEVI